MRYPALSRLLAVFLAVLSVTTIVAGALGFDRAGKDYKEQRREDALLENRITTSEALRAELAEKQADYDAASAVYPGQEEQHRSKSAKYRMALATYTATRAGLRLGRQQLLDAAALMDESLKLFWPGFSVFEQAENAFAQVYQLYLTILDSLSQGAAIYDEAKARLPEDAEGEVVFSPEEVLALAELGHGVYGQLTALLEGLRESVPEDQHEAADLLRQAVESFNEAGSELAGFSVERLAYGFARDLYDEAAASLEAERPDGLSEEEARAAADRLCMESFGLSFEELGQWLDENEPAESGGSESVTIPPEMMGMLFDGLPDDRELIDTALALIADSERSLSEKEAAFRADPYDMGAAELLLEAGKEGLDSVGRLLDLLKPTILAIGKQMLSAREQLDAAYLALMEGQRQVEEGLRGLQEQTALLPGQLLELLRERRLLSGQKLALERLEAVIGGYEESYERLRSLRGALLADDEIYERQKAGEDYLAAAQAMLDARIPAHHSEFLQRCVMCALMLISGLIGLIAALGAFEKPRIRRMWLPLLGAVLPSVFAEAIALRLGRGLLYSALFVIIFALSMLPLCQRQTKGEKA